MPTVTTCTHDFRHTARAPPSHYGGIVGIRRVSAETWAGIAILAVVVGAATPVLARLIEPTIPYPLWVALFVAMIIAICTTAAGIGAQWLPRTRYWFAVVATWVLLLTASASAGFFPVIVVVTATMSVYIVSRPVTVFVVVVNTAVIATATHLGSSAGATEIAIVTLLYLLLQVGTVMSAISGIREQELREELTATNIELQAAGVLLEESARTAERLRISRDLHDSIGHRLTVLNLALEAARHGDPETARAQLASAATAAHDVLDDLRDTVSSMRDEPPDLATDLRDVVDGIPDLDIGVSVDADLRVDLDTHEVLVRAVQEIATNTLRHAEAGQLRIRVHRDADGAIRLDAHDDGRGDAHLAPGNGLSGMIERFDTVGGRVDLDGSAGFSVRATVPAS